MGVHDAGRSERPLFRIPSAGSKMLRVDGGQSDNLNPSQEDHSINSPSQYPKRHINYFNLASHTRGRNIVLYHPSGDAVRQESSDSVFSTDVVQVPPHRHHARNKLRGGYSPVQVKAAVGFGQNDRRAITYAHSVTGSPHTQGFKSEMHINPPGPKVHPQNLGLSASLKLIGSHPAYFIPNRFNRDGPHWLQKGLKPIEQMDMVSPGSNSAGKGDAHMSVQTWSPRGSSSDVTSGARGYAHVRHLKPGFEKTRYDTGLAVPAGKQPSGWHPPQQDRAQTPVQGKFKPFQRVSNELLVHNHSDNESASTSTETTVPPGLSSTASTVSGVPLVNEDMSTVSVSTMQTEGHDEELEPQVTIGESRTESSTAAGPSLEEKEPLTVSTSKLQPTEEAR